MATLIQETQVSLCSVCINRPNCLKDLEFYRLEQSYSLSGKTCGCLEFKSKVATLPVVESKKLCQDCELRAHCAATEQYHGLQFQKGIIRNIVECPYYFENIKA